jgi:hypothetical protein
VEAHHQEEHLTQTADRPLPGGRGRSAVWSVKSEVLVPVSKVGFFILLKMKAIFMNFQAGK